MNRKNVKVILNLKSYSKVLFFYLRQSFYGLFLVASEAPPVKETAPPKQAVKPKKESKSPPSEPEDKKDNINIIFIGHVGKNVFMNSTICHCTCRNGS